MTDQRQTLRNLYVMLAYAFKSAHVTDRGAVDVEAFDHLHDLIAEILIRGVGAQVKRGLHHDYVRRQEELATVRGRINVERSLATQARVRGRLVSEFDELVPDTPHNRVLKSVITLLIRHGDVSAERKGALRRLLPYLSEVAYVAPTSIQWSELRYHRAYSSYRLLLGLCELVVRGLIATPRPGEMRLGSWFTDEALHTLYEHFILGYFATHHPELKPAASMVEWDYAADTASGLEQLPAMKTDVTLRRGHRMLILEAKCYQKSMAENRWGKLTLHSANLYQLLAYVKNMDPQRTGGVSGILVYMRTDDPVQPDLDITVQGNRIGARTLDLAQPWVTIRHQLEELLDWLDERPAMAIAESNDAAEDAAPSPRPTKGTARPNR